MEARIDNSFLRKIPKTDKILDVWDNKLPGFVLRIYPSGNQTYLCSYRRSDGRRTWISLGRGTVLTPSQARDAAKDVLSKVQQGRDPVKEKRQARTTSLKNFVEHSYQPWVKTHRKTGKASVERLYSCFPELLDRPLNEISAWLIEKWRSNRKNQGISSATINRDLTVLKSILSKALEWEVIDFHPLQKVKPLHVDSKKIVRFLSVEEETLLRSALDNRESRIKRERETANQWRRERCYPELPSLNSLVFVDYLKPATLLSMNTGLRRGELLSLTWDKVNFDQSFITIDGTTAKSGSTRHIPLNREAMDVLLRWWFQNSKCKVGLIFPGINGKQIREIKSAWKRLLEIAEIKNFRWHDLRHHFASKLAMAGVNLNCIRELLGHSDLKMTLVYSHLSPREKFEAVNRISHATEINSHPAINGN